MPKKLATLLSALLLTAALHAQKPASRKVVTPDGVTPASGAAAPMYSPGILIDGTLYVSGQVGGDIKTGDFPTDFEAEVKLCLDKIGAILKAAGMTFDNVVAVQIYLTDMDLFARMNTVYAAAFKDPRPARTTVGVTKLANAKARIEITVTARK